MIASMKSDFIVSPPRPRGSTTATDEASLVRTCCSVASPDGLQTFSGLSAALDDVTPVSHSAQSVFEFFLLFWAPTPEKVAENAAAMLDYTPPYVCVPRGRTPPVPTTEWQLESANGGGNQQPFVKLQNIPETLQLRVNAAGARTGLMATVGGVYEAVLGDGFEGGHYVPALASLSPQDDGGFGPYVGLRRLEDFTRELMVWAQPMDWFWQAPIGSDPHPLLLEPIAKTIATLDCNEDDCRKTIKLDYVSGVMGTGLNLRPQPFEGQISHTTALCKGTSMPGTMPRVEQGMLKVLYFNIIVPHGQKLFFSDQKCVACMAVDSCASNARCGHICMCEDCYAILRDSPCPLCRCTEKGIMH